MMPERLSRIVHPRANFVWGRIGELVPDLKVGAVDEQGQPVEFHALALTDPDGEVHVYLFNEEGRQKLVAALTGGVVITKDGPPNLRMMQ
jgi:hypothetical protein